MPVRACALCHDGPQSEGGVRCVVIPRVFFPKGATPELAGLGHAVLLVTALGETEYPMFVTEFGSAAM